jgi:lysozyme family protein
MTRFDTFIGFVLEHETVFMKGHYGDYAYAIAEQEKNDPGGLTKFGIDQRSHKDVDIRKLTLAGAKGIYLRSYWGPSHAEALPDKVGEAVFDAGVNCGIGTSIGWLQELLRAHGHYHGAIDGQCGPLTIQAAKDDDGECFAELLTKRRDYYRRLAKQARFKGFLNGWMNRVEDLESWVNNQYLQAA